MDEHIETAFFGFGGTTKSIPELMSEIAGSSEYMEKALLEFNELRESKEKNKAYYYEGQELLKKVNSYLKRLNNRVSKLTVAHNRETRDYMTELRKQQSEEYISSKEIDVNKSLGEAIKASQRIQQEVKNDDSDIDDDDEVAV